MNKALPKLDILQKISMSLMGVLVFITFLASNLHAALWQSSDWLVSTVLPAVVIDLTNDERADVSATPLRRNSTLDAAATLKAKDMAKNQYFSHYSPAGVSPWHWFNQAGYSFAHAGENLAIHFTDSDEVVEAWMNSPTHRQNIIDNKYTEIGVGTAKGKFEGHNTVYVVQLFGTPAAAPAPIAKPVTEAEVVVEAPAPAPAPIVLEEAVMIPAEEPVESKSLLASQSPEVVPVEEVPVATPEPVAELLPAEEPEIATPAPQVVDPVEEVAQEFAAIDPDPEPLEEIIVEPEAPVEIVVESPPVLESTTLTKSSGLEPLLVTEEVVMTESTKSSAFSLATQPNNLLQIIYFFLAVAVVVLLTISIVVEAKHFHFAQASYGAMLLFVMGGLWYFHSILTTGAVIV